MATDAAAVAAKWAKNASASVDAWESGIKGVTVSPGQMAVRQADAYIQGVQNALPKWKRNLGNLNLQEWISHTVEVGATRYPQGIQGAETAFQNFMTKFLPFVTNIAANLQPRGNLETNIQRMVKQVRETAKYVGS